jgi:hypothetical protein
MLRVFIVAVGVEEGVWFGWCARCGVGGSVETVNVGERHSELMSEEGVDAGGGVWVSEEMLMGGLTVTGVATSASMGAAVCTGWSRSTVRLSTRLYTSLWQERARLWGKSVVG